MTITRHAERSNKTHGGTGVPVALLQRRCACGGHTPHGGECEACRRKRLGVRGDVARPADDHADAPPVVHDALRSPGVPLDAQTRAFFESRFGHDFSRIRLHTDAKAAASARAVDAQAYTVGFDVVFGAGRYAPRTTAGAQLVAHELAHAMQQEGTPRVPGASLRVSASGDAAEHLADGAARDAMTGQSRRDAGTTAVGLARQPAAAPRRCPATHTIPVDVHKAIAEAWRSSGQGGATVTEQGGRIVTDAAGKRAIRTGSGHGGGISLPAEEAGDVTSGTFHTHPYSRSEGSKIGVSFSGADIENFIAGGQGTVKYVGAGTCIFVLDTRDAAVRDGCKATDIKQRWNDKFAKASGNFQLKVDAAVRAAIKGCGLCYYGTCSADANSPIPRTANLAGS